MSAPTKRIRENQGHCTDAAAMPADERDFVGPPPRRRTCTKAVPAPAFKHHLYAHPDAQARLNNVFRQVEMVCPHCGHSWRAPR